MDSFQQLIWWLFQSSGGAETRTRLVRALREEPRNAQQLATALDLDYMTVRHHLRVLERNRLIEAAGERYGQVYFLSASLEGRWEAWEAIVSRSTAKGSRR